MTQTGHLIKFYKFFLSPINWLLSAIDPIWTHFNPEQLTNSHHNGPLPPDNSNNKETLPLHPARITTGTWLKITIAPLIYFKIYNLLWPFRYGCGHQYRPYLDQEIFPILFIVTVYIIIKLLEHKNLDYIIGLFIG